MSTFSRGFCNAFQLESSIHHLMTLQELKGCQFDTALAVSHLRDLDERIDSLTEEIRGFLDYDVIRPYNGPINKPFKIDGNYTNAVYSWWGPEPDVDGPHSRVRFEELQLSKKEKLKKQLIKKGWVPTWYTEKGSPKLTNEKEPCPNLANISGFPGKSLSDLFTLTHRRSQINSLLGLVREDGRIPAGAVSLGTNTRRMRHFGVVNIPKAADHVLYGKEMRELFCTRLGYRMVGVDAAGLELRMLAHYMQDEGFINEILSGDIHSYNQELAGLPTRDAAKTFIYALVYGAGDTKIGNIVGGGAGEGRAIKERYFESLPRLGRLMERVSAASRSGVLKAIDGGPLRMRRDERGRVLEHKALNTLLQGGGSIVVKRATVIARDLTYDLMADQVLHFHDEFEYEVRNEHAEECAKRMQDAIRLAGEYYNLRIPLDGEAKIGNTWADVH